MNAPLPTDPRFNNLSGQRFGRLVVRAYAGSTDTRSGAVLHRWNCVCDCGGTAVILHKSLQKGATRSCGCLQKDVARGLSTKHGLSETPEYRVWAGMIRRCVDPKDKSYARYGGRGVTVCDRWRDSFAAFFTDMGPRPDGEHTIERKENMLGYEPGNCVWLHRSRQSRNRRNVKLIAHNGQQLTPREYCEAVGLSYHTFQYRRDVLKWPFAQCLEVRDGRAR